MLHSIEEYVPGFFVPLGFHTGSVRIGQRIIGVFSVDFS